jgi:hypothetical protein
LTFSILELRRQVTTVDITYNRAGLENAIVFPGFSADAAFSLIIESGIIAGFHLGRGQNSKQRLTFDVCWPMIEFSFGTTFRCAERNLIGSVSSTFDRCTLTFLLYEFVIEFLQWSFLLGEQKQTLTRGYYCNMGKRPKVEKNEMVI